MRKIEKFKIGRRIIGLGRPVFIVAELSGNHNKKLKHAEKIVRAACEAGVDAIKCQTYTPDTITLKSEKKWFKIKHNSAWKEKTLYELYKNAYTPWEWLPKLKRIAQEHNTLFFSSVFDETSVDFLEKLGAPVYKISSFEINDVALLKKIGSTKKPVIISRGMSSLGELNRAVSTLKNSGAKSIAILHCVSAYPAKPEEMNLATIPDLKKRFKTEVGLSDHTLGISSAIASVALGASIIEKHVTLNRSDGGPDAAFSLEPHELKELVKAIRESESAIGRPSYSVSKGEAQNVMFRRSLFAVKNIKKGEVFNSINTKSVRPGYGLPPIFLSKILGKKAKKDIEAGTPLSKKLIA
jgi:pseudaminic acid synthase